MKPIESFEVPLPPKVNYINAKYGLKSWLLTKDHKRIALLYLGSITFFFFIGGIYALMIRLKLLTATPRTCISFLACTATSERPS